VGRAKGFRTGGSAVRRRTSVDGTRRISVIIPTRNRPRHLVETLAMLRVQKLEEEAYEVIVVDDGSKPPVGASAAGVHLVRLEGRERSAARNAGAAVASGEVLVFLDDDIVVGPGFLEAHLSAHREWPGALAVGRIDLPEGALARPFARFRQALERQALPPARGIAHARNFCTAGNMSIARRQFLELEGFDEMLVSAEDQDLALRHSEAGGAIVFLPEAVGIHRDEAMDVRSYCRRAEWGSEHMVAFCRKHPAWPENIARKRANGPILWDREPMVRIARKLGKRLAGFRPIMELLFGAAAVLERVAPGSAALDRTYRALLGVHLYRGYRSGASRSMTRRAAARSGLIPKFR
jgi:GT2 family glycosyltransferase